MLVGDINSKMFQTIPIGLWKESGQLTDWSHAKNSIRWFKEEQNISEDKEPEGIQLIQPKQPKIVILKYLKYIYSFVKLLLRSNYVPKTNEKKIIQEK